MIALSKHNQRVYALVLLVFACSVMTALALWPYINRNVLLDKLTDLQTRLSGFDIVMAEGEDLANLNNVLAQANKKSGLLLSGATEGIAGANLQELILKHVSRNGGVVSQVQVLPPESENELTVIPVSLNLTTNTKGLRDIIFDLETSDTLLFIKDLVINPAPSGLAGRDGKARPQKRLSLVVSMKVYGYVKKGSNT